MKLKAARIVLDHGDPFVRSWCWRDEWITGYDSSYGLFAKFALLNVLTAREIARIFASSTCGKKTAMVAFPNVDLRDSAMFDLVAMSRMMRMDMEQVRESFLVGLLPNSQRKSSDHLKWCTKCTAAGFHTPIFQLTMITDCPIHGMPLQSRCRHCSAQVPYRFRHEVITAPFACPSCGTAFSSSLRDASTRSFRTKPRDYAPLASVVKLLTFEDEISWLTLLDAREGGKQNDKMVQSIQNGIRSLGERLQQQQAENSAAAKEDRAAFIAAVGKPSHHVELQPTKIASPSNQSP